MIRGIDDLNASVARPWRGEEIGWALLWLIGIPLPVVFAIYVISPH